jgi:rhodanese-related sulfurtransferase
MSLQLPKTKPHVLCASYNKSKRNVRELALLGQIASSVRNGTNEWVSSLYNEVRRV